MSEYLMKHDLIHPLKVTRDKKEVVLESLTLERLKAKHLIHFPEQEEGVKLRPHEIMPLLGALAGLSEDEAGELELDDIIELAGKLIPLLSEFPGTGDKSSGE